MRLSVPLAERPAAGARAAREARAEAVREARAEAAREAAAGEPAGRGAEARGMADFTSEKGSQKPRDRQYGGPPRCLLLAFTFGLGSAFSAWGFNLPFLVSSLVSKLGFQLPFLLLLCLFTRAPLSLVWGSFLGTEIVELAVVWQFYRAGRWLRVRV
jgi:hypothetical protein